MESTADSELEPIADVEADGSGHILRSDGEYDEGLGLSETCCKKLKKFK